MVKKTGIANDSRKFHVDGFIKLHQLAYFSTSLLPPLDAGGRKQIKNILKRSRIRNKLKRVTGALTYNEFHFAQVLEGRRPDVEQIFSEIKADARHTNVFVVEEKPIFRRDFPDWVMGYVGGNDGLEIISSNFVSYGTINKESENAIALIEMMKFFLQGSNPLD